MRTLPLRRWHLNPYASETHSLYHHHHHHVVRPARISLTLSLHVSLSFIASGRSSGLHPVSSHSSMYVRAGRPAFDWPYAGVHRSKSLTSSSLLLQQCPAYRVCLACIVFVIGGRWPYSWCFVGCCCQDLFNNNLLDVAKFFPKFGTFLSQAWQHSFGFIYINVTLQLYPSKQVMCSL